MALCFQVKGHGRLDERCSVSENVFLNGCMYLCVYVCISMFQCVCVCVCVCVCESVSSPHSWVKEKTHLLVHLLCVPLQHNAATAIGQRGLTVGFKWRREVQSSAQKGWKAWWWVAGVKFEGARGLNELYKMGEGGDRWWGAKRKISAAPTQIEGQQCRSAYCQHITQYWERPGFMPDASVCFLCVCFKVTQFSQQDDSRCTAVAFDTTGRECSVYRKFEFRNFL